jgi:hypothetical protein
MITQITEHSIALNAKEKTSPSSRHTILMMTVIQESPEGQVQQQSCPIPIQRTVPKHYKASRNQEIKQGRIPIQAPHRTINTHPQETKSPYTKRSKPSRCPNKQGGEKRRRNERVHEMGKESQASEREPKESDREPRQEQA